MSSIATAATSPAAFATTTVSDSLPRTINTQTGKKVKKNSRMCILAKVYSDKF